MTESTMNLMTRELSTSALGRRVRVYRNLGARYKARGQVVYSVADATSGLVLGHATAVQLADAEFKVSAAGRERVRATGRKAVHAVIEGNLDSFTMPSMEGTYTACGTLSAEEGFARLDQLLDKHARFVTYNPFKVDHFVNAKTGARVDASPLVRLSSNGVEAWV